MKYAKILAVVSIAAMAVSTPAIAKKKDVAYVMVNEEMGVPVFHMTSPTSRTRSSAW